jgi:hypothetical protein
MKPDTNNISSININGTLSNNGQIIAKAFNNYFISVAQNILLDNLNSNNEPFKNDNPLAYLLKAFNQSFSNIKLKFTSSKEIEDITNSLTTKYSHGYDGISTKVLKLSIPYILSPLTYICNRMLFTGIFPTRLKFSKIKPNLTIGPISMLTSLSKIFEKVILIDYITMVIIIIF